LNLINNLNCKKVGGLLRYLCKIKAKQFWKI